MQADGKTRSFRKVAVEGAKLLREVETQQFVQLWRNNYSHYPIKIIKGLSHNNHDSNRASGIEAGLAQSCPCWTTLSHCLPHTSSSMLQTTQLPSE